MKLLLIITGLLSVTTVFADTIDNWQIYRNGKLILKSNIFSSQFKWYDTIYLNSSSADDTLDIKVNHCGYILSKRKIQFVDINGSVIYEQQTDSMLSIKKIKIAIGAILKSEQNKPGRMLLLKYFDNAQDFKEGVILGLVSIKESKRET